jgi:copper chaperone CopZ
LGIKDKGGSKEMKGTKRAVGKAAAALVLLVSLVLSGCEGCSGAESGAAQGSLREGRPKSTVVVLPGLSCGACRLAVRRVLQELDGVQGIEFARENRLRVQFDPNRVSPAQILEKLAKAGYPAKEESAPPGGERKNS